MGLVFCFALLLLFVGGVVVFGYITTEMAAQSSNILNTNCEKQAANYKLEERNRWKSYGGMYCDIYRTS